MSPTVHEPPRTVVRRASAAGFLGTMVEAYDFIVFTYIIVYTAPLFFPSDDPAAGILNALLVMGTGFMARPLGGIFFGRLGDRRGRRFALVATITGMGGATFAMGLLPTYGTVGVLAPILLVLVRLLQGFCAGGEVMGSTTFVSEHATEKNHGRLTAMTPMGFAAGTAVAPSVVALVSASVSEEAMATWGWRVALLLSLPATLCVLILRRRLEETPEFRRLQGQQKQRKAPVSELFKKHIVTVLKVITLSVAVLMAAYVVNAYLPIFLQQEVGLTTATTATIAAVSSAFSIIVCLSAGFLIDRIGRKATMILIMATVSCLMAPIMYAMKITDGNIIATALGYMILLGLTGAAAVPAYAAFTAMFPAAVRYTGAALGYGVGSALGGGLGPYFAGMLTDTTGNLYASAGLVAVAAVLGIAVIATIPSRTIAPDLTSEQDLGADQRARAVGDLT